jgi:parvulin-like peptidyl-prolyl isomerase
VRSTIFSLAILLAASAAPADEPAPTTRPAASQPHDGVVATVADKEILAKDIDAMMAGLPEDVSAEQRASIRTQCVDRAIQRALIAAHVEAMACTEADVAAVKKQIAANLEGTDMTVEQLLSERGITPEALRRMAKAFKFDRARSAAASEEKIEQFIASSPAAYFDGTTVEARHILISCERYAAPAERRAAVEKLTAIAKRIEAGEVSFEDAARKHSACPSKAEGGDLGEFTFDRMAFAFAKAAFAMKAGQVSDIVRTPFGYHLIKVTGRTAGSGKPGPRAHMVAGRVLMSRMVDRVLRQAVAKYPVHVYE